MGLKITPTHLALLRDKVSAEDTNERRQAYKEGKFKNSDKVKDLNQRYRWDLLWMANVQGLTQELYKYLNDAHIDSALKYIVRPL